MVTRLKVAPALIFVAVVAVTWFVTECTYSGRQICAVGGNREAARVAGIPTGGRVTTAYVASAVLAGVVGVLVIGRMDVGVSRSGDSARAHHQWPARTAGQSL